MRHLVTAGAGFIGSTLCARLADDGHEVVCLDRPDRLARLDDRRADVAYDEYVVGEDSPALGRLAGCDVVHHLAHRGLPGSPAEQEAADADANRRGAQELLSAVREHGVATVVLASSGGTVYGAVDSLPATEATPCRPLSAYGASKAEVESVLAAAAEQDGPRSVSLRIGNAVGAGQLRGAGVGAPAKFLAEVAAGRPLHVFGDGTTVRDYVDVDDIVDAFVRAGEQPSARGPYNVGSGIGTSLRGVVDLVTEVSGRRVEVVHHPARDFDVPSIVLDHSAITTATGWRPRSELRETMARMWDRLVQQPG